VHLSTTGDARLATAGTGDVLSGIIGALLAQGVEPLEAASAGAWLHGRSAEQGPARGLVASDVAAGLPAALAGLDADGDAGRDGGAG
jgi:NAD(P)H-hydrate repair Nnr-like enzyme with NAD(P)H-hydrate dehydratase domain